MYYDSKVDMFATIDPNIAKKLPEKSLNKYRNYLDKGFVAHEDHSTGIKLLGDEGDSHNLDLDFFMFMFLIQESRTGGRSLLESGNSKRMLTKQLTKWDLLL